MLLDSVIHYVHGRILVKGTGTDGDSGRTTTTKTKGQTDFPWQILLVVKQNYISLTNLGILRDMGAGTYLNMVGTIQKLCQFSLQVHDFYYMSL